MDPSNYRHRVLHRLALELGLPKLNFQVIRRTIATLGKNLGHPKDIQGLMRHTRLATTMDVYMQSLEPEVRKAINSIHHELEATGTEGSIRKPPAAVARGGNGKLRAQVQTNASSTKEEERTPESERENAERLPRGKILLFAGKVRANVLGGVS